VQHQRRGLEACKIFPKKHVLVYCKPLMRNKVLVVSKYSVGSGGGDGVGGNVGDGVLMVTVEIGGLKPLLHNVKI
jgi:hypothetical protein